MVKIMSYKSELKFHRRPEEAAVSSGHHDFQTVPEAIEDLSGLEGGSQTPDKWRVEPQPADSCPSLLSISPSCLFTWGHISLTVPRKKKKKKKGRVYVRDSILLLPKEK